MRKFRIPIPLADIWKPVVIFLASLSVVAGLLSFRLGTITPGFTSAEKEQRNAARSVDAIVENPLFLKQKAGQFLLQKSGHKGPAAMRVWNAVFGLLFVGCMFIILKNWHTTRIAIFGTILFATSSWFLHTARLATNDIAFLMPLLLVAGAIWLRAKRFTPVAAFITAGAAVTMLYVPAMVLFVLPAIIWQRRLLKSTLQALSIWWQALVILVFIIGVAPLVWGLWHDTSLIVTWLGLPESWPSLSAYARNLLDIPLNIFVQGAGDPIYSIGNLPLLDVFTSVMVILGVFAYLFRLKLDRTKLLIGAGIVGMLLVALDGPVRISFLLPLVYVLAAAGMTLMLQQWFTVFPRNPFARTVSVIMISACVTLVSFYHLSSYFVAWPNVPATKAAFQEKP